MTAVHGTAAQGTENAQDVYTASKDVVRQQALDKVIGAEQDQATQAAVARQQAASLKAQQDAADLAWAREQQARADATNTEKTLTLQAAQQGVG
jgi:hypothetical protein